MFNSTQPLSQAQCKAEALALKNECSIIINKWISVFERTSTYPDVARQCSYQILEDFSQSARNLVLKADTTPFQYHEYEKLRCNFEKLILTIKAPLKNARLLHSLVGAIALGAAAWGTSLIKNSKIQS